MVTGSFVYYREGALQFYAAPPFFCPASFHNVAIKFGHFGFFSYLCSDEEKRVNILSFLPVHPVDDGQLWGQWCADAPAVGGAGAAEPQR